MPVPYFPSIRPGTVPNDPAWFKNFLVVSWLTLLKDLAFTSEIASLSLTTDFLFLFFYVRREYRLSMLSSMNQNWALELYTALPLDDRGIFSKRFQSCKKIPH